LSSRISKKVIWEVILLKYLLIIYILFCLIIAGLNYGLAPGSSEEVQKTILKIWHFYENQFKTILIIIGSILTLRTFKTKSSMRRRNLTGFILAAFVVHIIGPIILQNGDLYFFSMPIPWSSTALQLMNEQSGFYQSHIPLWGSAGISAVLIFYGLTAIVIYSGTLLMGRRWQCSTICLFNGFISETFSPAFPIIGKRKKRNHGKVFIYAKWIFLIMSIFFTLFWFSSYIFNYGDSILSLMATVEVVKYLSLELLMAMFLWIVLTGRGYCNYCPLGTVLGYVSKIAGQKIVTDKSDCINCRKCDTACPMDIEISSCAIMKQPVLNNSCVGCGHCVDICPVKTLKYSTRFLEGF